MWSHASRAVRVRRLRSIRLRRRPGLARCAWIVSLLVLTSLAAGTARARDARAEAAAPPLGVLIVEDPSTDWGRRVQGQLSDLPASAEIQAAPTLAAPAFPGRALPSLAATAGSEKVSSRALTAWLMTG